ncbi:MAG: hypothetical protein LAO03_04580 [Acidobacteriia bacterium]|nr:hypothetical protein [Terriglobia bacterium]
MRQRNRLPVLAFLLCLIVPLITSAQAKPGLLNNDELKKAVPSSYFFSGQSAPVQLRNSAGFRTSGGKLVLAGLVDTSGYASDVAQKYQGFLITEIKLTVGGSALPVGTYGFGFSKDGKFMVMDVAGNDVLSISASTDDKMAHPVPLKMVEDGGAYKLYSGKKWVSLKAE